MFIQQEVFFNANDKDVFKNGLFEVPQSPVGAELGRLWWNGHSVELFLCLKHIIYDPIYCSRPNQYRHIFCSIKYSSD